MTSVSDIRSAFLGYFKAHGHEVERSSPLVPHNDPTLLFTNAGMVQFKNVFTGAEKRAYTRAATSQKCVRAGGKHNDLDNVGYTARHHTFFEMLGNFSFGDYFKDLAIELAWNLVTKEYGLDAKRLLVTVYHEDDDAATIWKKIAGLPDSRIIRIASDANFWRMGETGPCGPCSEIFFDHGESIPGGPPGSKDEDGDRFIEIWNLVFMQYEERAGGERVALPRPSIDTGMGLERISAVLQGKHDNYDIDLMRSLIVASAEASGAAIDGPHAVSHRVVADHLRAVSFLIADGVLPSNEGRGYVLRRIMRRAMRHAHMMGSRDPLMWRLVPALVGQMAQAYPELNRAQALITETLKLEETRFRQTLERGLRLLDEELEQLPAGGALPGEIAFRLYDTYGFPLDLTQDALRAKGRTVDVGAFNKAMARQREEARKAWVGSGDQATEAIWFEIRERVGASEFLGYETEFAEGKVVALTLAGREVPSAATGSEIAVVLNQTPFYAESGGQVGDRGVLFASDGTEVAIDDTQKKVGDLHVHLGKVKRGTLRLDQVLELRVDGAHRSAIRANHSATHLLHAALRQTLGDHVTQKGSLVEDSRLRFDISHPKALSDEEIAAVEALVNREVRVNAPVATVLMTPDDAVKNGAMALFGEKYGEEVRVVSMGGQGDGQAPYSVELCGGTHARRTGDIGLFKIIAEGAVAAGVRRIEAVTGRGALEYVAGLEATVRNVAAALRVAPPELEARTKALVEERRRLEKELTEVRRMLATGGGGAAEAVRDLSGLAYYGRRVEGVPARDLRGLVDDAKKKIKSGVVAIVTVSEGKAALAVGVTEDLVNTWNAVDLVKIGAETLGGKGGGGRPDMAQAGGPAGDKADEAIEAIAKRLAS
ncbi:MAG: alanine--tRNA ligase [Alphaproteobacteria bacterium]|nr:alanine--tRNA ligase [Alphaproteobacteria bacterium]